MRGRPWLNRRERKKEAKEAKLVELGNGVEDSKIIYDIMEGKMPVKEFLLKREIDPFANARGLHKCTWTIVSVPREFQFVRSAEGADTALELAKVRAELATRSQAPGSKPSRSRGSKGKKENGTTASDGHSGFSSLSPPEVSSSSSSDSDDSWGINNPPIDLRALRRGHHTVPSVRGNAGEVLRPRRPPPAARLSLKDSGFVLEGDRKRKTGSHSTRIANATASAPPSARMPEVTRMTPFQHSPTPFVPPQTTLGQDANQVSNAAEGPYTAPVHATAAQQADEPVQHSHTPMFPASPPNLYISSLEPQDPNRAQQNPSPTATSTSIHLERFQPAHTVSGRERTLEHHVHHLDQQPLLPASGRGQYQPAAATHQQSVEAHHQQHETPASVPLSVLRSIELEVLYLCVYPHEPEDHREIRPMGGEHITVHRVLECGWCFVSAVGRTGERKSGWMPYYALGSRVSYLA
uniref:SH3 domain-containing protein n=1 Tax=Chromera velia CCMP2878 TaxID=1169474 RepID=A0A0G4FCG0_9ALVE|eukprot:Cvel_16351.t1-p1 / transcript=Cvel_16351.t1 / gene=Cvel_16351 / organism=Chromera_velia_CCMP2878 / gene_product=hypothetical protein / transcript_product=hypothetical protein / location=Cvel_scaffold1255:37343-39577(-) / protein_length=464 / sequence_SO=supercontig / SO=protein_coding / is_pseudo=false